MSQTVWTVGGSKADLETLLNEIRQLEKQHGEKLIPEDSRPKPLPLDPDAPMGKVEWHEVVLAIATSAIGSAIYEGAKALVKKYVTSKPSQATFTETNQGK